MGLCAMAGAEVRGPLVAGQGVHAELKLLPAKTWQEGVANHMAYTEPWPSGSTRPTKASRS